MRFESKQSFFKKVVFDTHNMKNVFFTLSMKHQRVIAYYLDAQNLLKSELYIEKVHVVSISLLDATLRCVVQTNLPHLHTVLLSKDVCLHGTQYANVADK